MKYLYKCEECNLDYSEIREVDHPATFSKCRCGIDFTLIGEEESE